MKHVSSFLSVHFGRLKNGVGFFLSQTYLPKQQICQRFLPFQVEFSFWFINSKITALSVYETRFQEAKLNKRLSAAVESNGVIVAGYCWE